MRPKFRFSKKKVFKLPFFGTRLDQHSGIVAAPHMGGRGWGKFGPALNIGAQSLAPALLSAGLPHAAAVTAVVGQAADAYSQLRSQMGY